MKYLFVLFVGSFLMLSPAFALPISTQAPPAPVESRFWTFGFQGGKSIQLKDGRMLMVGGASAYGLMWGNWIDGYAEQASILDPAQGRWSLAAKPFGHLGGGNSFDAPSLTLLADGRVLVTGKMARKDAPAPIQIYDPKLNKWSLQNPMHEGRVSNSATLLADGRVFVMGGRSTAESPRINVLSSSEIFNPKTGTWKLVTPSPVRSWDHSAILLPDGRVLVTGGRNEEGKALSSTLIYDPQTDNWVQKADSAQPKYAHQSFLLGKGQVIVGGGDTEGPRDDPFWNRFVEVYDISTNSWTTIQKFAPYRQGEYNTSTLMPLKDGRMLYIYIDSYNHLVAAFFNPQDSDHTVKIFGPTYFSYRRFPMETSDGRILVVQPGSLTTEIVSGRKHWEENSVVNNERLFSPKFFESKYIDSHQRQWSQAIAESDVLKSLIKTNKSICAELGARMPTLSDVEDLIRDFDHEKAFYYMPAGDATTVRLTSKGLSQFQAAFPDMLVGFYNGLEYRAARQFVIQTDLEYTFLAFSTTEGRIVSGATGISWTSDVRCVK